ncbi:MAG: VWA domain-containing protein [Methylotenera sp.]|uniref:VWA domain-containing protein n=1 Tax=Methylotenera sp. TaxID=2051956 RepID=UPI00248739C0|nr:VWA domain-containing protein [Methylotenera sp.]MDI1308562.1 VWA domain-containing protein [Methylotenera sp.]
MKKLIVYFKTHRDSALLGGALLMLVLSMFHITVPVRHNIYTYLLVADITQSMNTVDTTINGKPASRMAHTQKMLHEVVSSLPCGTKVSVGLFAGGSVAALYNPIEVCNNFAAIQDTIDHLDWRTAWSGNSRLREGMFSITRAIRSFPETAQVVFFTDGEEAPKLHAFNTKDLTNFQGADGWLLVGVGSEKGASIPKLSEKNQLIGYWSNESFALQPGIAQISESNLGVRDDNVASGEQDRFISKLNAEYMKSIAKEIGSTYVDGDNVHNILDAMKKQKPARRDVAPFDLSWVLASLAGLLLLAAYFSKHPIKQIGEALSLYRKNAIRKQHTKNELAIAHDNHIN